jgi:hypothetical protein
MLAGVWLLVMVPLADVVNVFGWADKVLMPSLYGSLLAGQTLRDTILFDIQVYQSLVLCMGLALLFSVESGRRRGRLDWTRRWGVLGCFAVLLLTAVDVLFLTALVTAGIAAVLMSIAVDYQPGVTQLFVNLGYGYLKYGPPGGITAWLTLGVFSSLTVMLACAPLYDALRATVRKEKLWAAMTPPMLLMLLALVCLADTAKNLLGLAPAIRPVPPAAYYFDPQSLIRSLASVWRGKSFLALLTIANLTELAKWGSVLSIAVWLTVAQFLAWRAGKPSAKT